MSEGPYFYSRTEIETDWTCGQKLWLSKFQDGLGIIPVQEASYFIQGREIHEDLAAIANGEAIDNTVRRIIPGEWPSDTTSAEILARRVGWAVGFKLFVEPIIRAKYENVSVESEIVLDRTPLWIGVTPDRVLRDRSDGKLVYREYKTSKDFSGSWMAHWPYAIQLHLGIAALEEELGESIKFAQIQGLLKGGVYKGRMTHPYVYSYVNRQGDLCAYKPGLELVAVWNWPGGVVDFVTRKGEDVAREVFPLSEPIFADHRLIESLVDSRLNRAREIDANKETARANLDVRRLVFEPRYSQCRPQFGSPCPYLACCHNATIGDAPLASGMYVNRIPHHELEIQLYKENA